MMPRGVIGPDKVDGRSARATGRTQQFATRVTPEWHETVTRIAEEQGLKLVEVLERALNAYEREAQAGSVAERLAGLILSASREEQEEAKRLVKERRDGGATGA